ncbi:MAG TPA: putative quinol monooxygenase [Candidatus Elarobacter sp.]|jgi:quinol monooxygenase YgiN
MLVLSVVYQIPDDRADEVERMFAELGAASRAEPGNVGYEVMRGGDGARSTFVLFEKWRDQAALDTHMAEEHFVRLGVNGVRKIALSRSAVSGDLIG